MSTGFIAYGRRKTPILPPTMDFPAGTKRDDAVAAFEAAYPGWTMDHAESLVEFRDKDGTVEADFAEGDFCDACGAFIPKGEEHGADVDDNPICAACVALYREHRDSEPPPVAE